MGDDDTTTPELLKAKLASLESERAKVDAERHKIEREAQPLFWLLSVGAPVLLSVLSLGFAAWNENANTKAEIELERQRLDHTREVIALEGEKRNLEGERDALKADRDRLEGARAGLEDERNDLKAQLARSLAASTELQGHCQGTEAQKAISVLRRQAVVSQSLVELAPIQPAAPRPARVCRFASYRDGDSQVTRAELSREDPAGLTRFDKVCALGGEEHRTVGTFQITCACS